MNDERENHYFMCAMQSRTAAGCSVVCNIREVDRSRLYIRRLYSMYVCACKVKAQ